MVFVLRLPAKMILKRRIGRTTKKDGRLMEIYAEFSNQNLITLVWHLFHINQNSNEISFKVVYYIDYLNLEKD